MKDLEKPECVNCVMTITPIMKIEIQKTGYFGNYKDNCIWCFYMHM